MTQHCAKPGKTAVTVQREACCDIATISLQKLAGIGDYTDGKSCVPAPLCAVCHSWEGSAAQEQLCLHL